jgi:sugar O-acyltransferase (sialic acid O-acetyltransferase NeuD family)
MLIYKLFKLKKMKIIFGNGGFAHEVISMLITSTLFKKIDYIVVPDGNLDIGKTYRDIPIISESEFFNVWCTYNDSKRWWVDIYITIGNPQIRKKVYDKIMSHNILRVDFPNLIHSTVKFNEYHVKLGTGNIICEGTIFTTDINIGDFNHINLSCTIGHDVEINNFVTLSPAVNISGKVKIDECCFFGTNSCVLEDLHIESYNTIGAGAVVTKDIKENFGTYVGIPAKKIK